MRRILQLFALCALCSCGGPGAPQPFGACPTPAQTAWHRTEMNMFCHFGPNTFSGLEWGEGTEPEDLFNPTALDCGQWAATARAAGFGAIILTAKHHDGFCLWPSPVSSHSVASSSWEGGRGDVLASLSRACREAGLGFGVYISPWDRNDPTYGTPAYNEVFRRTIRSVHEAYGPVFEQWFDGACGEGPDGKVQVYDWPLFNSEVASLSPDAVIFSDVGPGCRWVGNESGRAGETNWNTLDTEGFTPGAGAPPTSVLESGNRGGAQWVPAEADVSIRPGWFWKASETAALKSVDELFGIYLNTVGRGSVLLLNVPPDSRGLIDPADSCRLMQFRARLDSVFARDLASGARIRASCRRGRRFAERNLLSPDPDSYWAAPDGDTTALLRLSLPSTRKLSYLVLQEYLPLGQRVCSFEVEALSEDGSQVAFLRGTTIGHKRILPLGDVSAKELRISINESLAPPVLSRIALY